jgi:hypothetical protein
LGLVIGLGDDGKYSGGIKSLIPKEKNSIKPRSFREKERKFFVQPSIPLAAGPRDGLSDFLIRMT